ncbi:hypothetical protein BV20DRAFT_1119221 [Pilatotrama ljubarskyi]|nr:hypothetical protein BV20DRAFT_1119221 [Pilatotrama ljubarskyi]
MAVTRNNTPQDGEEDAAAPVFTSNGRPVFFYLYGTNEPHSYWALSQGQREELSALIEENGGHICRSARDADTIIVNSAGLDNLRKKYELERTKYVELPSFVRRCISKGRYMHDPVMKLPMGGVPPKRTRTNFTAEDDRYLCKFLASYIPYPEAGGRLGRMTYITLMEKAHDPDLDYEWAKRHTAESWRERYKKKQVIFDPIIAQMVKENPPPLDGKGVRPHDRRVNGSAPLRHIHLMEEEEDDEDDARLDNQQDEERGEFEQEAHVRDGRESGSAAPWPQPHSRHTEIGPQPSNSPVEQPRGRVQSAPHPQQRTWQRDQHGSEDEDTGEFSYNPDPVNEDENHQPGSEDAGPSETRHTPSPPPPPPQRTRNLSTQGTLARPRAGIIAREPSVAAPRANRAGPSQVPMSSQATLVGPVPTQLRGAAAAAKLPPSQSRSREEEPRPPKVRASKRRKIVQPPPEPPAVLPEPLRETGTRPSRSTAQKGKQPAQTVAARKTASSARPQPPRAQSGTPDDREEEDEDDEMRSSDEVFEPGEAVPQTHGVVPTLEDERFVEDLLETSAETSGRVSPDDPFAAPSGSEELDSDDQRTREKLLPGRQERHSRMSSMASSSRNALMISRLREMGEMEVDFAKTLDLTRPATRERSVSGAMQGAGPSRGPNTLLPEHTLRRGVTEGSTSSLEGVPLAGTRASAHKEQSREYVPPPGTKARSARESGLRPSPPKLELRNRVVNRPRKV